MAPKAARRAALFWATIRALRRGVILDSVVEAKASYFLYNTNTITNMSEKESSDFWDTDRETSRFHDLIDGEYNGTLNQLESLLYESDGEYFSM